MWSRRAQCIVLGASLAVLIAGRAATLHARQEMPAPVSALLSRLDARTETYTSSWDSSLELRFYLKPNSGARADRLIEVTRQSLRTIGEWLGPLRQPSLTVVDVPWHSGLAGSASRGTVVASTRWLSIERDGAADRELISAIAREYWMGIAQPSAFEEGLSHYTAARAIDAILQGRQYWSQRFIGGFIPVAIRSVPLSSPRSQARGRQLRFTELRATPDGAVAMRALQTLERHIGFPALQQGLAAFRERFGAGGGTAPALLEMLNEQGARDLSWFAEAFRSPSATMDYAVAEASSEAADGKHRVTVSGRRLGEVIFAGPIPVLLRFADGTALHDRWDGREGTAQFDYVAQSPLVDVEVDPDVMLLLDADRTNNVKRLATVDEPRELWRGLASWIIWLQDFMLTGSALS